MATEDDLRERAKLHEESNSRKNVIYLKQYFF